jgi:hypothetical protein
MTDRSEEFKRAVSAANAGAATPAVRTDPHSFTTGAKRIAFGFDDMEKLTSQLAKM